MTKHYLLLLLLAALSIPAFAQKTAYIPNYLQNPNDVNGAQFTWSKTRQSANFTLIWGNTVGIDPANYPDPNLAFDPVAILDTMEYIYTAFKGLGFLDDAADTKLSQYKIPIVMYATWGPDGAQGFANGGDADGIIGAFWVHPTAMHDSGVAAHELAHSLQAQCVIDYRTTHGLGPVWNNAGIFWETHANFMRNLLYPKAVSAWGMDVYHTETFGDWKNTYENYELLLAIMESEGINMVNRLWRESLSGEYPLQAYKRLAGYNQAQFNDSLFLYARRMATFDFNYNNIGAYFRQYRNADLSNYLYSIQAAYSILKKIPGAANRYEIPIETAPEEFAYNVIPLYPESDSCAVILKFKGHTEANSHAGWRYGFIAAHPNGTISRYSPTYADNTGEIIFQLQGDETKLFLVVMGAPFDQITTNPSNDTWHGYPKHFRYPYELNISGAVPEGFQNPANFRAQLKNGGHLHSNGGGWVQNSATVAASVYVGPTAMVLGNANLSGQVRLENTALVKNAVMSGQVHVLNNAFVNGGNYSGSAVIQGQGFAENVTMSNTALIGMRAKVTNYNLSGTVEVGGDVIVYNENGSCNNGVYYRLTNYYDNKLLECDGRTANHPVNKDVNNTYPIFSNAAMAPQCQCAYQVAPITVDSMAITPVNCLAATTGSVQFYISKSCGPFQYAWSSGAESGSNLSGLTAGDYTFSITDALGRQIQVPLSIGFSGQLQANFNTTPISCYESADGSATLSPLNGTAPFTWLWQNGETGNHISGIAPGDYAVTLTDALGCSVQQQFSLSSPAPLGLLLEGPASLCPTQEGLISPLLLGGTLPYAYTWSNTQTDETLHVIGAGSYRLSVTDSYGCTVADTLDIAAGAPLELSLVTSPVHCFDSADGSAGISPLNGAAPFQWLWDSGQTDSLLSNLISGAYALTVTDALGCAGTLQFSLSAPPPMVLESSSEAVRCFGEANGMAAIAVSGGTPGYTYLWNNQALTDTLSNVPAGVYSVTVTDINGCSSAAELAVNSPTALVISLDGPAILCPATEGSTIASASGGTAPYTFQWSDGSTGPELLAPAGAYILSVTDVQGCLQTQILSIAEDTPLNLSAEVQNATALLGADGAILITDIAGGVMPYIYQWSNGASTASLDAILPGEYSLSIMDAAGCISVFSYTVSFETGAGNLEKPGFSARIVPNPTKVASKLQLEVQQEQRLEIQILDAYGRVLWSEVDLVPAGKGVVKLPEGYAAGLYWVWVRDGLGRSWVLPWLML